MTTLTENRLQAAPVGCPNPTGFVPGAAADTAKGTKAPVFILGVMERSGTNFLADILQLLDPNLQLPRRLGEDFLLEHSHLLDSYVESTYRRWKRLPWLDSPDQCRELLFRNLGQALLSLLYGQIDDTRRLLAKTPRACNIDKFPLLFPEGKLVMLVRDGRDVVESAAATWPYESYEYWMKEWAEGARLMLDFIQGIGRGSRGRSWELVKYEDLAQSSKIVVRDLLNLIEVENDTFDWHAIQQLPIRGSSQHRDEKGNVDWTPIEKHNGFTPIGRWSRWSWRRKRKFKQLAGRELIELGYVSGNHW